jgi:hypothetical protein
MENTLVRFARGASAVAVALFAASLLASLI